jgi:hypothetical protein
MIGSETLRGLKLPPSGHVVCRECKRSLPLAAHAQTLYVGCGHCNHLLELRPDDQHIVAKRLGKRVAPTIPLGSKGKLRGTVYQVVGFLRKKEAGPDYYWNEYVLFNPMHGYAFLAEYNGHWNYLLPTNEHPYIAYHTYEFEFEEEYYHLFAKYKAKVMCAVGEFHWNPLDDKVNIEEFIAPPYSLVYERGSDRLQWFQGEYIEPDEIWSAFQLTVPMPEKIGVGATQPLAASVNVELVKKITAAVVAMLLLIQIFLSTRAREATIFKDVYPLPDSVGAVPIVTPAFTVDGGQTGTSNLEFTLYAPVDNDWLELEATLINDQTGEEYRFEAGVEYYSGYEGGESWSEGSRTKSRFVSAVPEGSYHLNLFPTKSAAGRSMHFELQVKQDVPMLSNFYLTLLAVLVFPVFQWWRISNFERQRWINSDYEP